MKLLRNVHLDLIFKAMLECHLAIQNIERVKWLEEIEGLAYMVFTYLHVGHEGRVSHFAHRVVSTKL